MTLRRVLAPISMLAAVVLASCSSSGGSGSGASGSGGGGTTAVGLAKLMKQGSLSVSTAHIELNINAAGQAITGSGDETLEKGKLTGLTLEETLPGGAGEVRVIVANGKTYAKLPSNSSSKPWALVTKDSSDPEIQQLASSVEQTKSSASLGSFGAFAAAAKKVAKKGSESVNGVDTTHYSVIVDPSKLPTSNVGKQALAAAGVNTLPVELYLDGKGRPIKVTEDFSVKGQQVSTTVTVSKYGQPVTIQAPPADEVAS